MKTILLIIIMLVLTGCHVYPGAFGQRPVGAWKARREHRHANSSCMNKRITCENNADYYCTSNRCKRRRKNERDQCDINFNNCIFARDSHYHH